nr:MAG TPA: hypothetical protein [Caudoviricetes sp.]
MSIIQYRKQHEILVGIPFTWGCRWVWAIKVDGGDIYFLENGRQVKESEKNIIESGIVYANSIEIK